MVHDENQYLYVTTYLIIQRMRREYNDPDGIL